MASRNYCVHACSLYVLTPISISRKMKMLRRQCARRKLSLEIHHQAAEIWLRVVQVKDLYKTWAIKTSNLQSKRHSLGGQWRPARKKKIPVQCWRIGMITIFQWYSIALLLDMQKIFCKSYSVLNHFILMAALLSDHIRIWETTTTE